MTTTSISLVVAVIIALAVIIYFFLAGRRESRHLDKLHITGSEDKPKNG